MFLESPIQPHKPYLLRRWGLWGSTCFTPPYLTAERVKKIWHRPASRWGRSRFPVARGPAALSLGLGGIERDYSPLSLSIPCCSMKATLSGWSLGNISHKCTSLHLYRRSNLKEAAEGGTSCSRCWGMNSFGCLKSLEEGLGYHPVGVFSFLLNTFLIKQLFPGQLWSFIWAATPSQ